MFKNVTIISWECHINIPVLTFIRAVCAFQMGRIIHTYRYGTVRYGTVRYGAVRYGTVRYGTVR